ncbi:cytochrome bd oxidase small subunit CydS [Bacillus sp. T33-2]|nr:hypothetical protein [Bacillus sp. T33-2]
MTIREFLVFYAPFIVIVTSIAVAFWLAQKDDMIRKANEPDK